MKAYADVTHNLQMVPILQNISFAAYTWKHILAIVPIS